MPPPDKKINPCSPRQPLPNAKQTLKELQESEVMEEAQSIFMGLVRQWVSHCIKLNQGKTQGRVVVPRIMIHEESDTIDFDFEIFEVDNAAEFYLQLQQWLAQEHRVIN